jgi:hypothetical protein
VASNRNPNFTRREPLPAGHGGGRVRAVASEVLRSRAATDPAGRRAVTEEMLRARDNSRRDVFDPTDPRWMLARATQEALQGAMLAFEDRKRLLALAQRTGIRAFDANLIVAIVQDRARRGEPIESAAETIAVLPKPVERGAAKAAAWTWAAAIFVAVLIDAVLIGWVLLR